MRRSCFAVSPASLAGMQRELLHLDELEERSVYHAPEQNNVQSSAAESRQTGEMEGQSMPKL